MLRNVGRAGYSSTIRRILLLEYHDTLLLSTTHLHSHEQRHQTLPSPISNTAPLPLSNSLQNGTALFPGISCHVSASFRTSPLTCDSYQYSMSTDPVLSRTMSEHAFLVWRVMFSLMLPGDADSKSQQPSARVGSSFLFTKVLAACRPSGPVGCPDGAKPLGSRQKIVRLIKASAEVTV